MPLTCTSCLVKLANAGARPLADLQQLRRRYGASAQDNLARSGGALHVAVLYPLHSRRPGLAAAAVVGKRQTLHGAARAQGEVCSAGHWVQEGVGHAPPQAIVLVDVEVRAAGVVAAVELADHRHTWQQGVIDDGDVTRQRRP